MTDSGKAVVLLSGGLDSATAAAVAKDDGFIPHALTIAYGQRHAVELKASGAVAASLGIEEHRVVELDLRAFGASALTDDAIAVPKDRVESDDIPATYVPARNTIFLSLALGYAESIGAHHIYCGVNAVDYSGYPDCRPAFIIAFEKMANLATRDGVEGRPFHIHAPLINKTKVEIIHMGVRLGVDYALTHSCYDPAPNGDACGHCDSCLIRATAFREAGVPDPTRYV